MTRTGATLAVIALAFVTAEVVRPTQIVPKKIAAHALLLRTQAAPGGTTNSLNPELLEDLPRIHPDAVGSIRATRRSDGALILAGTLAEPSDGSPGSAAFLERDGSRTSEPAIHYGAAPQPQTFSILIRPASLGAPGPHRLSVALISADQRGFFLLPQSVTVRVGR
jgi:hypothetical protein